MREGAFTHRLKRPGNDVLGVDLSPTAIAKATARHPECRWRVLAAEQLDDLAERFDLAVAMEVLSYLENWRSVIGSLSRLADWLWITLYLPPDPIGFVKSFDELRDAVSGVAAVQHEMLLDGQQLCLLAQVS